MRTSANRVTLRTALLANSGDVAKAEQSIPWNVYIIKEERFKINDLRCSYKKLEREAQTKSKVSRIKEGNTDEG